MYSKLNPLEGGLRAIHDDVLNATPEENEQQKIALKKTNKVPLLVRPRL